LVRQFSHKQLKQDIPRRLTKKIRTKDLFAPPAGAKYFPH